MNNTQYLLEPEINGLHKPATPNIKPGGQGVTFLSDKGYIAITVAPGIRPIVEYISIANTTITNVNKLTVVIVGQSSSTVLTSPFNSAIVTGFPDTPLPYNTTFLITFETNNKQYPYNVTLSLVACFNPGLTTQGVSTTFVSTSKFECKYHTHFI